MAGQFWQITAAVLGFTLLVCGPRALAEDGVEQYLRLDQSYDGDEPLLDVSHGIDEIVTGLVTTGLDQELSYDLSSKKIEEYQVAIGARHEEGIGFDLGLGWDGSWSLTSGVSHSIQGNNFDLDLAAGSDIEIYQSDLGDDFSFDDEDDFFFDEEDDLFFDDEDDDAAGSEDDNFEWVVDYSLHFAADLAFEPLTVAAFELRPAFHVGLAYESDFGWDYEAAAGIGIALSPAAAGREAKLTFASSNVSFSHAGGSFTARPGEVVFAGGRSGTGIYKLAALIFNEWEPTDNVSFEFGAVAEFEYEDGDGLVFDEAELVADAALEPAEDWEVTVSAGVFFDSYDAPEYAFSAEIGNSSLAAFEPSAAADLNLGDGETELALSLGVNGALSDAIRYSIGVDTDIEPDGSVEDVDVSVGLNFEGPPLVEDGDNSELSLGGSYAMISQDLSLNASISMYF